VTKLDLFLSTQWAPDLDGEVVTNGDKNLRVGRVEGDRVDDVRVRVLVQTEAVVAVPQIAMLVLRTTETTTTLELEGGQPEIHQQFQGKRQQHRS